MSESIVLEGKVEKFGLTGLSRRYIVTTLPFGDARKLFSPEYFNIKNGRGEQRQSNPGHVNKIAQAMNDGSFTPCAWHVGLRKNHQKTIVIDGVGENEVAKISVSHDDPLPLDNGNHRRTALEKLRQFAVDSDNKKMIESIDRQPITAMIMIDGDSRKDFINLQIGKTVDASHMLCLRNLNKSLPEAQRKVVSMAIDMAKTLNTDLNSPFAKMIRFDTGSIAPIPVNSLCPRGASDLSTSLVGASKLVVEYGIEDRKWFTNLLTQIYTILKEKSPAVLGDGNNKLVLTPPPEGTKGSATMMIGVANCMAYYLQSQGRDEMIEEDKTLLVNCVNETLNRNCTGSFSSPMKRTLVGQFAKSLFAESIKEDDKHEGIPKDLIALFCTSTFGVSKLQGKRKVTLQETTVEKEEKLEEDLNANNSVQEIDEFAIPDEGEAESPESSLNQDEQVLVEA